MRLTGASLLSLVLVISNLLAHATNAIASQGKMNPLVGTPLYVLEVPDAFAVAGEERNLSLVEIRTADEDHRFFSGSRTLALIRIPQHLSIVNFALAGFTMTADSIDVETIYVLDQNGGLWCAALSYINQGTPRPQLQRIQGRFSTLQTEASGEVFAMDSLQRLTRLTSAGADPAEHRLPIFLLPEENVVQITGTGSSGLQILTNFHRVLLVAVSPQHGDSSGAMVTPWPQMKLTGEYSLTSIHLPPPLQNLMPSDWSLRGSPLTNDFWVLDQARQTLWLRTLRGGHSDGLWIAHDLSNYLQPGRHGNQIQILGFDANTVYLRAGTHYLSVQRLNPSPRALALKILAADYFTTGLRPRGINADIASSIHVVQPWNADRTSTKRYMDVRNIKFEPKHGILEFIVPGGHFDQNGRPITPALRTASEAKYYAELNRQLRETSEEYFTRTYGARVKTLLDYQQAENLRHKNQLVGTCETELSKPLKR